MYLVLFYFHDWVISTLLDDQLKDLSHFCSPNVPKTPKRFSSTSSLFVFIYSLHLSLHVFVRFPNDFHRVCPSCCFFRFTFKPLKIEVLSAKTSYGFGMNWGWVLFLTVLWHQAVKRYYSQPLFLGVCECFSLTLTASCISEQLVSGGTGAVVRSRDVYTGVATQRPSTLSLIHLTFIHIWAQHVITCVWIWQETVTERKSD